MQHSAQQQLIRALENPAVFPHAAGDWQLIETHISWVVLCGSYAYKIKKALDLGFLDFSTLERRKFYCAEELRLNSRLAPELYLEVVAITGTVEQPRLETCGQTQAREPGAVLEYAVKMRRFPSGELLSDRLAEARLEAGHIAQLAGQVAAFHLNLPAAGADSTYGDPEQVHAPVRENFAQIRELSDDPQHLRWLEELEGWTEHEYQRCHAHFEQRKRDGFVRECHGDMHLGNMALIDGVPVIFDGIEFNPDLYWIDVMSEVAFLCMDLQDHGRSDYAFQFLNGYLESTGDYAGLQVLRYYLVYRALVRAKIACIRLSQQTERDARALSRGEFERYLQRALEYTGPPSPVLLITHGLSGSGKSTLAAPLARHMGAICIRSDRERQRCLGRGGSDGGRDGIAGGVYSSEATEQTYARLERLAGEVLASGYPVIVDATFLARTQRALFERLAARLSVPLRILYFHADSAVLRQRVAARQRAGDDISEAGLSVLEHQLETYAGLEVDEQDYTLYIDTELACDAEHLLLRIRESLQSSARRRSGSRYA